MEKYNPWYYHINNELVKKMKPCLPDNYVHLNSIDGCYKVVDVCLSYFRVRKNNELRRIRWDDFRCMQGQGTSEESYLKKEVKHLKTMINLLNLKVNTIKLK